MFCFNFLIFIDEQPKILLQCIFNRILKFRNNTDSDHTVCNAVKLLTARGIVMGIFNIHSMIVRGKAEFYTTADGGIALLYVPYLVNITAG